MADPKLDELAIRASTAAPVDPVARLRARMLAGGIVKVVRGGGDGGSGPGPGAIPGVQFAGGQVQGAQGVRVGQGAVQVTTQTLPPASSPATRNAQVSMLPVRPIPGQGLLQPRSTAEMPGLLPMLPNPADSTRWAQGFITQQRTAPLMPSIGLIPKDPGWQFGGARSGWGRVRGRGGTGGLGLGSGFEPLPGGGYRVYPPWGLEPWIVEPWTPDDRTVALSEARKRIEEDLEHLRHVQEHLEEVRRGVEEGRRSAAELGKSRMEVNDALRKAKRSIGMPEPLDIPARKDSELAPFEIEALGAARAFLQELNDQSSAGKTVALPTGDRAFRIFIGLAILRGRVRKSEELALHGYSPDGQMRTAAQLDDLASELTDEQERLESLMDALSSAAVSR